MKKRIELLVLFLLFVLLSYVVVQSDGRSSFHLLYTSSLALGAAALFFGNLYFLFPNWRKKRPGKFFLGNGLLLMLTYFTSAFFSASYMADISNSKLEVAHLIHPTILQDALSFLLTFLFLGLVYAFIRYLFLSGNFRLLKKVTFYTTAGIGAVGLVFFINYQLDVNYEGDTSVRFIEEEYTRFEEISQLPQFRNKVVYVDLWFSSCSPCLQDFTYLPKLKAQLKNQDVEYLYLARETSHPNSRQRWKNAIKKFNLQGWHVYMNKPLSEQVWEMIFSQEGTPDATGNYPRYLLIDKNGRLVSFNAKKPSEGDLLIQEITALLR